MNTKALGLVAVCLIFSTFAGCGGDNDDSGGGSLEPTGQPTPNVSPTPDPTSTPTPVPSPTAEPTPVPTVEPTSTPTPTPTPPPSATPAPFSIGLLPDTQGGSDSTGQAHVAMHPMAEVLKQQSDAGVDMVIALGDLTDNGSTLEFAEWRSVAEPYAQAGIEFLPVMGNHETSYAYTVEWIRNMRDFIPEDAVHMPGYEWVNYYVVRENVLIIGLAYYNLPVAFEWIKQVYAENENRVDHVVIASHDGLIGAKYGETLEHIVDGAKDDNWVYDVQPQIRDFLADIDAIYVQGHEHQYQRSVISAKTMLTTYPSGSTPSGGNYRMDVYTQIMAGNASYKGYEFRYGERDLVQAIIAQKNATMSNGSAGFDVNSSILRFDGARVDYWSWFAPHTATSNAADQAFAADWKLLDTFSRTTNRCEALIYPDSIPEGTRPVMVLQTEYISDDCIADDGTLARLVGGTNATFNRTNTRTRDLEYTPGISRAESLNDLLRLAYQWLFQVHESWSPNLNSAARVIPDVGEDLILIPETSIDLKEHVSLSWLPAEGTLSDSLVISGLQNQTGMFQGAYGTPMDLELDAGLAMSSPTGDAKAPVTLPATASKHWDISDAVADTYAVEFIQPDSLTGVATLAKRVGDSWVPLASAACVISAAWDSSVLSSAPARDGDCSTMPLVGYDQATGAWWAVLDHDIELALITAQ